MPSPILKSYPQCTGCEFSESATNKGIGGRILRDSKSKLCILLVAQSPGSKEDRANKILVGPSGRLVTGEKGYVACLPKNYDVWGTNAVKCLPLYKTDPKVKNCRACIYHLQEDIRALQEAYSELVVVCLGKVAVISVLGLKTLEAGIRNQGKIVTRLPWMKQDLSGPIKVYSTYHPAFLLRKPRPALSAAVEDHLKLIVAKDVTQLPVRVLPPKEFLERMNGFSSWDRPLSLDIETYGIRSWNEQTAFHPLPSLSADGVPIGRQMESIAFAIRNGPAIEVTSLRYRDPPSKGLVRVLLEKSSAARCPLYGTNILFDLSYLRTETGWTPAKNQLLYDVCILSFIENPDRPERSLKDLSPLFLEGKEAQYKKGARYDDDESLLAYNRDDVINPLRLWEVWWERIKTRGWPQDLENLLGWYSRVLHTLLHMTNEGAMLDVHKLGTLQRRVARRLRILIKGGESRDIQLEGTGSGTGKEKLFAQLACLAPDLEWEKTKKKGQISTGLSNTRRALNCMTLPFESRRKVRAIMHHKDAQKLLGTYLKPLEKLSDDCGRIFPQWFPIPSRFDKHKGSEGKGGTRQGRVTCRKPGLQTSPPIVKKLLKSRYPGGTLVWADYSQLEMRVAALVSGDERLLQVFRDNRDVHQETLDAVEGRHIDSGEPNYGRKRKVAKGVNFGILFGGGPQALKDSLWQREGLDVSFWVCKQFIDRFARAYPQFMSWRGSLLEEVQKRGRLELPITGQWLSFSDPTKVLDKAVLNFPIQGPAANVGIVAQEEAIKIMREGELGVVPIQIYDSLGVDFRCYNEGAMESIVETMQNHWYLKALFEYYGRAVPIKVDVVREE